MVPLDPHIRPHPDFPRLAEAMHDLVAAEATPWSGVLYRMAEPTYAAREDRLDGVGARIHGGRWNPACLACVYGSLDPETALSEILAVARYYGLPLSGRLPQTLFAFDADLRRTLDLTRDPTLRTLRVAIPNLQAEAWRSAIDAGEESLTQALGRAAASAGLGGLVVPSAAADEGRNLAIFPASLTSKDRLRTRNPKGLQPNHQ